MAAPAQNETGFSNILDKWYRMFQAIHDPMSQATLIALAMTIAAHPEMKNLRSADDVINVARQAEVANAVERMGFTTLPQILQLPGHQLWPCFCVADQIVRAAGTLVLFDQRQAWYQRVCDFATPGRSSSTS
jgi:hypothetical protein